MIFMPSKKKGYRKKKGVRCKHCNRLIERKKSEPWEEGYCDKCLREGDLAQQKFEAKQREIVFEDQLND